LIIHATVQIGLPIIRKEPAILALASARKVVCAIVVGSHSQIELDGHP
jgi:hypothetical protein